MTTSVTHDTFTIERHLDASPARAYSAFADPAGKRAWFGEGATEHTFDFRVGGHETLIGQAGPGGPRYTFDAVYQDIRDAARIVYSYEMTMDGQRISVSVATVEFLPEGAGTHLIITEQGAYLDGLDNSAQREQGTHDLIDALIASLNAAAPVR